VTDGWGQSGSHGWKPSPAEGWDSGDGGWGTAGPSGDWGAAGAGPYTFTLPKPVSVVPLVVAIVCGVLGIALSRFATPTNIAAPIIGWSLCTVGDVLGVAWYQRRDLSAAFDSMNYRSSPAGPVLRAIALTLAVVGIVANSLAIAHWAATR
jgi:hypothetical protein